MWRGLRIKRTVTFASPPSVWIFLCHAWIIYTYNLSRLCFPRQFKHNRSFPHYVLGMTVLTVYEPVTLGSSLFLPQEMLTWSSSHLKLHRMLTNAFSQLSSMTLNHASEYTGRFFTFLLAVVLFLVHDILCKCILTHTVPVDLWPRLYILCNGPGTFLDLTSDFIFPFMFQRKNCLKSSILGHLSLWP